MILLDFLISVTLELSTFFQDARFYDTIGGFNGVLASLERNVKMPFKNKVSSLESSLLATGELGQHH